MNRNSGFTLLELVIVLAVGALLLGFSVRSFSNTQSRLAADQAARSFEAMVARARAQAIEGGVRTRVVVSSAGDSLTIRRNGEILETLRFQDELGVDLTSNPTAFVLCMGPRGFADLDCNTFTNVAALKFSQGSNERSLELLPMGQVVSE